MPVNTCHICVCFPFQSLLDRPLSRLMSSGSSRKNSPPTENRTAQARESAFNWSRNK